VSLPKKEGGLYFYFSVYSFYSSRKYLDRGISCSILSKIGACRRSVIYYSVFLGFSEAHSQKKCGQKQLFRARFVGQKTDKGEINALNIGFKGLSKDTNVAFHSKVCWSFDQQRRK
jgi:hypothetical protein